MYKNQFNLLTQKRFLPLFITQFMGAFNDNVFKNGMVTLITYVLADKYGYDGEQMIVFAAGLFILPMVIFSATAGQVADKYEKSKLINYIKFAEIFIMGLGCIGFYFESIEFLMVVLFLMGAQSAFFGPLKYSILPDHLKKDELISANALITSATFLSILLGILVGTLLILKVNGVFKISLMVFSVATIGWASSLFIPKALPHTEHVEVNWNFLKSTVKLFRYSTESYDILLSVLGISWFWLLGATYIAQVPAYVKNIIHGSEDIIALFLVLFSVGVGIGALLCNWLLKGKIKSTFVPWGAMGLAVFGIDLYFASIDVSAQAIEMLSTSKNTLMGVREFLSYPSSLRIALDLTLIAVSGGIYVVPFYAVLQSRSKTGHRARVIASNNVINSFFMVLSAVMVIIMLNFGFSTHGVFLTISIMSSLVALSLWFVTPIK